jgi:hypothetical protein
VRHAQVVAIDDRGKELGRSNAIAV